jgi:hypothetical protein
MPREAGAMYCWSISGKGDYCLVRCSHWHRRCDVPSLMIKPAAATRFQSVWCTGLGLYFCSRLEFTSNRVYGFSLGIKDIFLKKIKEILLIFIYFFEKNRGIIYSSNSNEIEQEKQHGSIANYISDFSSSQTYIEHHYSWTFLQKAYSRP